MLGSMYSAAPLIVEVFDTTDRINRAMLDSLLALNGSSIVVQSVHTAATTNNDINPMQYHWVTVVYRRINEPV